MQTLDNNLLLAVNSSTPSRIEIPASQGTIPTSFTSTRMTSSDKTILVYATRVNGKQYLDIYPVSSISTLSSNLTPETFVRMYKGIAGENTSVSTDDVMETIRKIMLHEWPQQLRGDGLDLEGWSTYANPSNVDSLKDIQRYGMGLAFLATLKMHSDNSAVDSIKEILTMDIHQSLGGGLTRLVKESKTKLGQLEISEYENLVGNLEPDVFKSIIKSTIHRNASQSTVSILYDSAKEDVRNAVLKAYSLRVGTSTGGTTLGSTSIGGTTLGSTSIGGATLGSTSTEELSPDAKIALEYLLSKHKGDEALHILNNTVNMINDTVGDNPTVYDILGDVSAVISNSEDPDKVLGSISSLLQKFANIGTQNNGENNVNIHKTIDLKELSGKGLTGLIKHYHDITGLTLMTDEEILLCNNKVAGMPLAIFDKVLAVYLPGSPKEEMATLRKFVSRITDAKDVAATLMELAADSTPEYKKLLEPMIGMLLSKNV